MRAKGSKLGHGNYEATGLERTRPSGLRRYLEAVEEDLAEDAGVVEIETAMLEHYRAMMSEMMQALADSQGLSPRAQANST
jgi:hypothetical protein